MSGAASASTGARADFRATFDLTITTNIADSLSFWLSANCLLKAIRVSGVNPPGHRNTVTKHYRHALSVDA